MSGATGNQRRIIWRILLTLWNLLAPGLALVRTAGIRAAIPWMLAPYAAGMAVLALFVLAPVPRFAAFVVFVVVLVVVWATVVCIPAILTWRSSLARPYSLPWWSRWYGLLGFWLLLSLLSQATLPVLHAYYKPYYIPGLSMMPTLAVGDRLFADMRDRGLPHRGEVVIYECGGIARVSRVAALPGDRVAMRDDRPIVNGLPAAQRDEGSTTVMILGQARQARVRRERLPGEARHHHVLVVGGGPFADMPETSVPIGRLFLLGDNRDLAADSRVPTTEEGCGMVAVADVLGRPLFVTWSRDHNRIGTDLTRG